jgi:hypothetical protein
MNPKSIFSYIGAAVILGLITAVTYFLGYVYTAAFFGYCGVSPSMFNLPREYYLLSAWNYVFYPVACLSLTCFLCRQVWWVGGKDRDIKRLGKRFPELTKGLHSWGAGVGPSALLFLLILCLTYAILDAQYQGRADARSIARQKREIKFEKFGSDLHSPLYFLAYADGKYVVYTRPDPDAAADVYVLNEAEVGKVKFTRP